jgi:uncharacterized protein YbjT (DUF2867 family)
LLLVTAAHGNQGKLLIPRLLAAGVALRASVRSDESARTLRAAGVTDIVVGDLSDPDVLAQAMNGVEKVYYIGPALHPREREMGSAAIDAARAAGVQHFVFSSVLHAIITDLVQHEIKRDLEEYLISSGWNSPSSSPPTTCCAIGSGPPLPRAFSVSPGPSTAISQWWTWVT